MPKFEVREVVDIALQDSCNINKSVFTFYLYCFLTPVAEKSHKSASKQPNRTWNRNL